MLLSYRLPREPSSPRIALWRKLKRLGVVQVLDGLVALPMDGRTREQLDWLADEVIEAGGEALVWIATLGGVAQERELAQRMTAVISEDYLAVVAAAEAARGETARQRARTLGRLRRELRRIRLRDHFQTAERERAHVAVERLALFQQEAAA